MGRNEWEKYGNAHTITAQRKMGGGEEVVLDTGHSHAESAFQRINARKHPAQRAPEKTSPLREKHATTTRHSAVHCSEMTPEEYIQTPRHA